MSDREKSFKFKLAQKIKKSKLSHNMKVKLLSLLGH